MPSISHSGPSPSYRLTTIIQATSTTSCKYITYRDIISNINMSYASLSAACFRNKRRNRSGEQTSKQNLFRWPAVSLFAVFQCVGADPSPLHVRQIIDFPTECQLFYTRMCDFNIDEVSLRSFRPVRTQAELPPIHASVHCRF